MSSKISRIFIEKKNGFQIQADSLLKTIQSQLNIHSIKSLRIIEMYDIANVSDKQLKHCVQSILVNPVTDNLYSTLKIPKNSIHFGVSYLPAQYDQRADSAEQCFQILYPSLKAKIRTSKGYIFDGTISTIALEKIKKFLINPVDSYQIDIFKPQTYTFKESKYTNHRITGFTILDKNGLNAFCQKNNFSFTIHDIQFIQNYYKKESVEPTIIELRAIETYWSDHCRHTTFNTNIEDIEFPNNMYGQLFKKVYDQFLDHKSQLKKKGPTNLMQLATMFAKYQRSIGKLQDVEISDEINASSIFIDVDVDGQTEKWLLQFKNETHNHPTEIEPFGGAATCLGGAIRDPLSGRSYIYQSMRISGSADPTEKISKTLTGKLSQYTISTEAAHGFSSYGNQIGLATTFVKEIFHPGYKAKRMEVGVVVGASPYKNIIRQTPKKGDIVILLGGRTGKDGIGGAVGSSKSQNKNSALQSFTEVQKGNAIEERKLQRFFTNPIVTQKIKKSNDFGAGGVAVAVGELADGIDIFLNKVPLKYYGLTPTEILLSESQERMAIVIDKKDVLSIIKLAQAENIEATPIATITDKNCLVVYWNNQEIVNLKRSFLNTNGAIVKTKISIPNFENPAFENNDLKFSLQKFNDFLKHIDIGSQKGLSQQFDATIGSTTVLMPFGGKYQLTPAQASVQLIQTFDKITNLCSVLSYGFDPYLLEKNPFIGAVYANLESVSKIVASGAPYHNIKFSYQEYFEKLGKDPLKWSKPFLALLGAYYFQDQFGLASIGGKDSMSGSYQDLHVPPTLIAFGITTTNVQNIISPEFKKTNTYIYYFNYKVDKYNLPNTTDVKNNFNYIHRNIVAKNIISASALQKGGIAEAIFLMSIGNKIGCSIQTDLPLFEKKYGGIIVESIQELNYKNAVLLGTTNESQKIEINQQIIPFTQSIQAWESTLDKVFPILSANTQKSAMSLNIKTENSDILPIAIYKKIEVCMPIFTGNNCEYDTIFHFKKNGGIVNDFIFNNQSPKSIKESIQFFEKQILKSKIICLVGGFSAADEPDGSGKYISTVLLNPSIQTAITQFLQKGGLILGICNGFQALIRSGLLPFGNFNNQHSILFKNDLNKHISSIVRTRITSNNSPWLYNTTINEQHSVAISHGEGKFIADKKTIDILIKNKQIATQYIDHQNNPTMVEPFNPNGAFLAIEGLISKDGHIFGKMGHNERIKPNLYKNIPNFTPLDIFKNAIQYLKK